MAGAPAPAPILIPWANSASPTYVQSPMPLPSQLPGNPGRASYTDGFPPQTFESILSGGTGPDGRDMNGALKDITTNIVAYNGGQYPQFSAAFAANYSGYAAGAIVAMANGLGLWINRVDSNTNNPDTSAAATSNWVPLAVCGQQSVAMTGGTITLTAVQVACNVIILTGTTSTTVVLPPWAREFTIVNQTTAGVVTVISTGSGSAVIPPVGFSKVVVLANGNVIGILSQSTFNT